MTKGRKKHAPDFRKKEKKRERNEERDLYGDLGSIGVKLIGEVIKQGVKSMEAYGEDEDAVIKTLLMGEILSDVFECEGASFPDCLAILANSRKQGLVTDQDYIKEYAENVQKLVNNTDYLKVKAEILALEGGSGDS